MGGTDFQTGASLLGLPVVIKNTLFDIEEQKDDKKTVQRRSASVPRQFRYQLDRFDDQKPSSSSLTTCLSDGLFDGDLSECETSEKDDAEKKDEEEHQCVTEGEEMAEHKEDVADKKEEEKK